VQQLPLADLGAYPTDHGAVHVQQEDPGGERGR
jgi:hypothetical protein